MPAIAARERNDVFTGFWGHWQVRAHMRFCAPDKFIKGSFVQCFQRQNLASRQQCAVKFETRVLCRRSDERYDALLDIWQKAILLSFVKPVDLIDEQEGSLPRAAPSFGFVENSPEVLHTGEDSRQSLKVEPGPFGQQLRNGGFPDARWPPQNNG